MIDVEILKQKLDSYEDILVLDVRTAEDYISEQGHIANALNITVEDLPDQIIQLAGRTEKTIAIICRTDRRSAKAAQILTRNGYADVHIVRNGMTAWNDAGYAIVK